MSDSRKRERSDSASDEEYKLQRKIRKIEKQLSKLKHRSTKTPPASRQRSLSPFAPVALSPTRIDVSPQPSRANSTERRRDFNADQESFRVDPTDDGSIDFQGK